MQLTFSQRMGNEKMFTRGLVLTDDNGNKRRQYVLYMVSAKRKVTGTNEEKTFRKGEIKKWDSEKEAPGETVWKGDLPGTSEDGPTPTRAFAIAAGLCDEDGKSAGLPEPEWAKLPEEETK